VSQSYDIQDVTWHNEVNASRSCIWTHSKSIRNKWITRDTEAKTLRKTLLPDLLYGTMQYIMLQSLHSVSAAIASACCNTSHLAPHITCECRLYGVIATAHPARQPMSRQPLYLTELQMLPSQDIQQPWNNWQNCRLLRVSCPAGRAAQDDHDECLKDVYESCQPTLG